MQDNKHIFVLEKNQNSREIIKTYLAELGYVDNIYLYEDFCNAAKEIKEKSEPPIVILDISDTDNMESLINTFKLYTAKIIVTSVNYSIDNIIKAMRYGAKEFLPKPILREDLKRALELFEYNENSDNTSESKILTIYSNKGGIGKTTIATNLAVELAKTTRDKVALIDLNLQLGDISTFLNLNPTLDVAYVIQNLIEKKQETILNAFERYKDTTLYVLSDPSYIEHSQCITVQQIESLFDILKRIFPYIIVDLSSNIDPISLKILDKSDWILFTTIVNIPALRNGQRCLNLFKSRNYPSDKIKILLNRYMENEDLSINDIETTLGEKIYWKIPNNYFSIMEAINKGIPVGDISSNSNIAHSFKDLALKISDDIVSETLTNFRKNRR